MIIPRLKHVLIVPVLLVGALPVSAATLPLWAEAPPRGAGHASETPASARLTMHLPLSSTAAHDPDAPSPEPTLDPTATPVVTPEVTPEPTPSPTASTRQPDPTPSATPDAVAHESGGSRDAEPAEPAGPAEPAEPADEPAAVSPSKVEARLLSHLNAERRSAGLGELEPVGDLVGIARDWSRTMAATGDFRHNPSLSSQMCCWTRWGENVAWGGVPDGWLMESTDGIHRNFMRSAPHRANILDARFDQVGIGAVVSNGKLWVTQVFRRHR